MQRLTALQHPMITQLIQQHENDLLKLTRGLGSPLHVVFPQIFSENVQRFKQVLSQLGIQGSILFAKKANKANCFVHACLDNQIGIDVASIGELTKALSSGMTGERIGISGPDKVAGLLRVAIHHNCLIAVDSLDELRRIGALAQLYQRSCRVLLRCQSSSQTHSRFGLLDSEMGQAFQLCAEFPTHIQLLGFSFHLSGYDLASRAHMANHLIELCSEARKKGFNDCHIVNIGGGIPVQYIDAKVWSQFKDLDLPQHYHALKKFEGFYPYSSQFAGVQAFIEILNTRIEPECTLAEKLKNNNIHLIVEPGRALLDQAGISLFRIQGIKSFKQAIEPYSLLTVDGSSFSLSEQWFNSEYLPDPIILPQKDCATDEFVACVGGASCLEVDMLTWRKIHFQQPVQIGDFCTYLNTAGYQMDSNESTFHDANIPLKVVVQVKNQMVDWYLDEQSLHLQNH